MLVWKYFRVVLVFWINLQHHFHVYLEGIGFSKGARFIISIVPSDAQTQLSSSLILTQSGNHWVFANKLFI